MSKNYTCKLCNESFDTNRKLASHKGVCKKYIKLKQSITMNLLQNLYTTKEYGVQDIADMYGLTYNVIQNKLKGFNIHIRTIYEKSQIERVKEKIKKRNNELFNCDYPLQNKDIVLKMQHVKKIRYGNKNFNNHQQTCKTNKKRYGNEHITKTIFFKNKSKQTSLKKYGTNYPSQSDIVRQKMEKTCLQNNGVKIPFQMNDFIEKSNKTKIKKYGNKNYTGNIIKRKSIVELKLLNILRSKYNNVCGSFKFNNKEFDIKIGNNIYEIDGDYWHPSQLQNLTFQQLNNVINDYTKIDLINNSKFSLFHIYISKLPTNLNSIDERYIQKHSHVTNYNISANQILMSKDYIIQYKNKYGISKLKIYIKTFMKFLTVFESKFINIITNTKIYQVHKLTIVNNLFGFNNNNLYFDLTINNINNLILKKNY